MAKKLIIAVAVVSVLAIAFVSFAILWPAKSTLRKTDAAHADSLELAEYSTRLSDCVACHSVPNGKPFAGGLSMGSPLGTIYSTNITPDPKTGIGTYSLVDFDNAVRHGVAKDGHRLYPAMPYPSYAKLSDDEIKLLYTYFSRYVAPVEQANRPSDISWPLNMRWPLAVWNLVFADPKTYEPKTDRDQKWNRGAYLVQGPGHCGSCHTPRGLAFQEVALNEDSPRFLSGALLDGWKASSLRGEMDVGLGRWSEADIVAFLKDGHNDYASVYGSMTDAFNNSTQYFTDDDAGAVAHYLKSLPPSNGNSANTYVYDPKTTDYLHSAEKKSPGAIQYLKNCVWCHGYDGKGQGGQMAALAGNPNVIDQDPESTINIILNGAGRVVKDEAPDPYRMSSFRDLMSDDDVAALSSFIRSAWGNKGSAVQKKDVSELRDKTNITSDRVVILRMR